MLNLQGAGAGPHEITRLKINMANENIGAQG
jgi:hypothetical protein